MEFKRAVYSRSASFRLPAISGELRSGLVTGVLGQNGVGKSTLLKALCKMEDLYLLEGSVAGLPKEKKFVKYLGQTLDMDFELRVSEILDLAFEHSLGISKNKRDEILNNWEVLPFLDRQLDTLSSGERQRVNLCRVLIMNPKVFCFDECFSLMDLRFQSKANLLVHSLVKEGCIVFLTSHDLQFLVQSCDQVILMNYDSVSLGLKEDLVTLDNLKNIFPSVAISIQKEPYWQIQIKY